MPLTPQSREYENKLAAKRKKAQQQAEIARLRSEQSKSRFKGNAKPVPVFSKPAPKQTKFVPATAKPLTKDQEGVFYESSLGGPFINQVKDAGVNFGLAYGQVANEVANKAVQGLYAVTGGDPQNAPKDFTAKGLGGILGKLIPGVTGNYSGNAVGGRPSAEDVISKWLTGGVTKSDVAQVFTGPALGLGTKAAINIGAKGLPIPIMGLGAGGSGSGFVRVGKSKAQQEVLDIAGSIAEEASKVAEFSPYRFNSALEGKGITYDQAIALGQKAVKPVSEPIDKARYVLSNDSLDILRNAADKLSENAGRASTIITQADLPKDVDILNIQRALALGQDATISPQSTLKNVQDFALDIAGVTPSSVVTKANEMFRGGADTARGIATTIFPDFVGNFNPTPMLKSGASDLIDILKEARGGIAPVTGRVLSEGEKVLDLSKQLYNANDHGSPKARAAATQAIEQLLAKVLDIKLPDSFYQMRQAELDLINDPNRNNVLIDFLGNTGKGGVSLPELTTFLQRKLQDPNISQHLRGAYSQLLDDALQGKYRQIQSEIDFIRGQGENPLSKIIGDDVYKGVGNYVDDLRSKLINDDNYTQAVFDMDMQRLGEAVQTAASNIAHRGKKLSWIDIDNAIKAQGGLF
jgi:hypothetical protein